MIMQILSDVVDFSLRYNLMLRAAARAQIAPDSSELQRSIFPALCMDPGTAEPDNSMLQSQRRGTWCVF